MKKEKVIQEIEENIKKCEDGSWTFLGIAKALLTALLYLVTMTDAYPSQKR